MAKSVKGKFITFEGSEGCGKSTQAKLLCDYLQDKNRKVLHIREPGGIKISEKIRSILLDVQNEEMTKECEVLLYMAARAQLVEEIIAPALKKGIIVVCDRFLDSTLAYQGYGCGIDVNLIEQVGFFATKGIVPDITFLLDMETSKGLSRIRQSKDRIEQRPLEYHDCVRKGYLALAKKEPKRIKVIEANDSKDSIQQQIQEVISRMLNI
ncbi:MAG: dTMP kinase [Candidatus Omnitrophica bacterium]|nr:dTMP kinase [Candidatus Omnitrophota bacterium]